MKLIFFVAICIFAQAQMKETNSFASFKRTYENHKQFLFSDNLEEIVSRYGQEFECLKTTESENQSISESITELNLNPDIVVNQMKFIAGKCRPVILVAGLFATKLMVEITSCREFLDYHPATYDLCFNKKNKKCVETDKLLWMTEEFLQDEGDNTCFTNLIAINNIQNNNLRNDYSSETKGFRVTFYGDTNTTYSKSECGLASIENLFDKFTYGGSKNPEGFQRITASLKKLGYTPGVNLFGLSYDWRQFVSYEPTQLLLKRTIDLAYKLSGKKVLIIAHSMGGLVSLEALSRLSSQEKETKINRLITIGTPYAGSTKALKASIFGTNDFKSKIGALGVHLVKFELTMANQAKMLSLMSYHQLAKSYFWSNSVNEPWYLLAKKRIETENQITNCINNFLLKANKKGTLKKITLDKGPEKILTLLEGQDNLQHEIRNNHKKLEATLSAQYKLTYEDESILYEDCFKLIASTNIKGLAKFAESYPFPGIDQVCNSAVMRDSSCAFQWKNNIVKEGECIKTFWDTRCRLDIELTTAKNPVISFRDPTTSTVYNNNIESDDEYRDLLKNYGLAELKDFDLLLKNKPQTTNEIKHPGVKVTTFALTTYQSDVKYNADFDPNTYTKKRIVVEDKEKISSFAETKGGDGTVENGSLFAPFLSWGFKGNTQHELEFVRVCSTSDRLIKNGKVRYREIPCECTKSVDDNCNHSGMLGDLYMIKEITTRYIEVGRIGADMLVDFYAPLADGLKNLPKLQCSNMQSWN